MMAPQHEQRRKRRPDERQDPLMMWAITIGCCVVALVIGVMIIGMLV